MDKRIAGIGDALLEINPEIKYTYLDDDYDTLEILSDHKKPTEEAIESAKVEAQKKIDATYYKIQRLEEYPRIEECIHAILDNDLEALQAKRKLIKDKFPKP